MSAAHDPSEIDWDLTGRYLAGELSARERAAFERWVGEQPARRAELAIARRLWDDAGAVPSASRVDTMWRAVDARMRASARVRPSAAVGSPSMPARSPRFAAVAAVAAGAAAARRRTAAIAAAVLAAVALTGWQLLPDPRVPEPPRAREFRTGPGQRATVQLGDGTRVELGVASAIVVAPFGGGAREVALRGEAVFDVVHDEARPFRVRSAGALIEDLGTRFVVRAYDGDAEVRVVVASGVVELRAADAPAATPSRLVAGQLGRLDSLGRVTVETDADTARYLAWTHGRVLLRNETLRDAVVEIERWHDVKISIPDAEVARMRITLDMHLGSLQKTLEAVTIPLGLRYDVSDQTARIYRQRRTP